MNRTCCNYRTIALLHFLIFVAIIYCKLLTLVADTPLFETGFLLAGEVKPADVQRQLSRWTAAGRLYQLRRGLYALAPPFQKIAPHPFLVANALVTGSYVSCQSALAHYGLIPEYVAAITSVCATRPGHWVTPLGRFEFRHIQPTSLFGYQLLEFNLGQQALVATAEKALLDLIHLQPQGDSRAFILYDLLWYLSDPAWPAPNLTLLNNALQQTGWTGSRITERNWRKAICDRVAEIDWTKTLRYAQGDTQKRS